MSTINKTPQVFVDLDELAAYIQKDNPDAAHRFLMSAEWTFNPVSYTHLTLPTIYSV